VLVSAARTTGESRGDVVLVQLLGLIDERRVGPDLVEQACEQRAHSIAPGIQMPLLEERPDGLLRGPLAGKRRPAPAPPQTVRIGSLW